MGAMGCHGVPATPSLSQSAAGVNPSWCQAVFDPRLSCWWASQAVTPQNLGVIGPQIQLSMPIESQAAARGPGTTGAAPAQLPSSSANREMRRKEPFSGAPSSILGQKHYVDGLLLLVLGGFGLRKCVTCVIECQDQC